MGRFVRLAPALLLLTCACAHSITITPALDALPAPGVGRIEKNVGYYIAPENLAKQVETPGGGGDKVKYFPYKESEPALKKVLSNIFGEVHPLPSRIPRSSSPPRTLPTSSPRPSPRTPRPAAPYTSRISPRRVLLRLHLAPLRLHGRARLPSDRRRGEGDLGDQPQGRGAPAIAGGISRSLAGREGGDQGGLPRTAEQDRQVRSVPLRETRHITWTINPVSPRIFATRSQSDAPPRYTSARPEV